MPFKHYIRSIEGKTESVVNKPFYPRPWWFSEGHVNVILNPRRECVTWFTWCETPQGHEYWEEFEILYYKELPPEPREIIDSWIAQVNGEL